MIFDLLQDDGDDDDDDRRGKTKGHAQLTAIFMLFFNKHSLKRAIFSRSMPQILP